MNPAPTPQLPPVLPEPEEGCKCPECEDGTMEIPRTKNCSCHINPPCGACTDKLLTCDSCGWEFEPESPTRIEPTQQDRDAWAKYQRDWEAARSRGHTFPNGGRIFNIDHDGRSGSTMVFRGQYEGEVTAKDIFEYLGDGTFGHRGPSLGNGRFTYTKITD